MLASLRILIFGAIGFLASCITVVIFTLDVVDANDDNKVAVALALLCILWIVYFFDSLHSRLRLSRRSRAANTIVLLNEAFQKIHELARAGKDMREKEDVRVLLPLAKEKYAYLCEKLAKAYSIITGTNCGATIKLMSDAGHSPPDVLVYTFARSDDATRKRADEKPVNHRLLDNSDFKKALDDSFPNHRHFFSNRLPWIFNYRNTSLEHELYGPKQDLPTAGVFAPLWRAWRWPLPYKSTIVVPICPSDSPVSKKTVGFLCIDSPAMGAFRSPDDVEMLKGVAEGIYNTTDAVWKLLRRNHDQERTTREA